MEKKMSSELIFIIGLTVGVVLGVITISLFASNGITDLHTEIRDLKIENDILKEKLEKPKGKPTPRKKRYRKQPTRK
tara:strand:+ start:638 stop:868 length:231 start_codon:yes stop_codon:yes gene_type:complete